MNNDYLFCCLSPEQEEIVNLSGNQIKPGIVYQFQSNLTMGKKEVTCNICGKRYPVLQICDRNRTYLPEAVSKLKTSVKKCKKRAFLFLGNHYYAINRNNLQRYEVTDARMSTLTFEVMIPKGTYSIATDDHERYFACLNFSGTLTVVDVPGNRTVARKRQIGNVGNYTFTSEGDNRILYFADNRIVRWDFIENKEEIVWTAPDHLSFICRNVVHNRSKAAVVFYCLGRSYGEGNQVFHIPFTITVQGNTVVDLRRIEGKDCLGHLVYSEELQRYSLFIDHVVRIYDDQFALLEEFDFPYFISYSDGGGLFPITRFAKSSAVPAHVYLSPDDRWMLLDYFSYAVLMDHRTKEVRYCLYNYKSSPYPEMGFLDSNHFWYTNGDSTYIQDIREICGEAMQ